VLSGKGTWTAFGAVAAYWRLRGGKKKIRGRRHLEPWMGETESVLFRFDKERPEPSGKTNQRRRHFYIAEGEKPRKMGQQKRGEKKGSKGSNTAIRRKEKRNITY